MRKNLELLITDTGLGPGLNDKELHTIYHNLIACEEDEALLMENCPLDEFDEFYNPGEEKCVLGANPVAEIMEAVGFDNYAALKKGIATMKTQFKRALKSSDVDLTGGTMPNQLKPRKNRMFAYVAVEFNFSDGQSVKMMFHSPGGDSLQIDMDQHLVAYAYTLNKRDVTHRLMTKEGMTTGQFVKQITQILLKNSEKFKKRQENLAQTKEELTQAEQAGAELEAQLAGANESLARSQGENVNLREDIELLQNSLEAAKKQKKDLQAQLDAAAGKKENTGTGEAEAGVEPDTEGTPGITVKKTRLRYTPEGIKGEPVDEPETPAAAEGNIWEKPEKELQTMNIGAVQKSYQALMDSGQDVQALMLMAKAVGGKANFKEARALFNQKQKKGELDGHYTDRFEKLQNKLEDKMTARMMSPTHVPPEEAAESEAEPNIWEKPHNELFGFLKPEEAQAEYQSLVNVQNKPIEGLLFLAKYLEEEYDVADIASLEEILAWKNRTDGIGSMPLQDIYEKLAKELPKRFEEKTGLSIKTGEPLAPGGELGAQTRDQIEKANDILAGKYDGALDALERVFEEMLTFFEANSADTTVSELADLSALIERVSDYYTALLDKAA